MRYVDGMDIFGRRYVAILAAVSLALVVVFVQGQLSAAPKKGGSNGSCAPGVDFIGFSDALDKQRFDGTNVGGLSAIAPAKGRDTYYALTDNEAATPARFYTVDDSSGEPEVVGITRLTDENGVPYTGRNFDGEGLTTFGRDIFISSETEPSIRRFSADGRQLQELPVPQRFLVAPAGQAETNQTFESLSLTRDGRNLFTATEGALAADGETANGEARIRILQYDRRGGDGFNPVRQGYYLAETGQGVVEILALSRDELLVMERGFVSGEGNTVRVFRVSLKGAKDVSDVESLAATNIRPVKKELLFDLADCPPSGATSPGTQENPLLDNFEAMTFGDRLPGGRRELLLLSDDNFNAVQVTRLITLGVDLNSKPGKKDEKNKKNRGSRR